SAVTITRRVAITITITIAVPIAVSTTIAATITTAVATALAAAITTAVSATIATIAATVSTVSTAITTAIVTGRGRWRITSSTGGTTRIHAIALFTADGEVVEAAIVTTGTTPIRRTCPDHWGAGRTQLPEVPTPRVTKTCLKIFIVPTTHLNAIAICAIRIHLIAHHHPCPEGVAVTSRGGVS
ncbi:hypothetical protein, partial [Xanthomonas vasicola]|uniref:hypothetical protein n=1 Tax=Xanthomonas vasicola TaxID=56459 RepID=UPI00162170CF